MDELQHGSAGDSLATVAVLISPPAVRSFLESIGTPSARIDGILAGAEPVPVSLASWYLIEPLRVAFMTDEGIGAQLDVEAARLVLASLQFTDVAPVVVGETLTVTGHIDRREKVRGRQRLVIGLTAENGPDRLVTTGQAVLVEL